MAFIEPGPRRVPRPQREDCGSFFSTGPWKGKASACLRICSHPTSFQSWQQADLAEVNMACLISLNRACGTGPEGTCWSLYICQDLFCASPVRFWDQRQRIARIWPQGSQSRGYDWGEQREKGYLPYLGYSVRKRGASWGRVIQKNGGSK